MFRNVLKANNEYKVNLLIDQRSDFYWIVVLK